MAALVGLLGGVLVAVGVVVAVVVLVLLVLIVRVLRIWRRLHNAARQGRVISSEVDPTKLPLTDFMREGHPGDPVNLVLIGNDSQVGAAFASAGWYRADEITLVTSMRIMFDSIFARKYSTAPVSNQYLFGHKQDIAYEQPGKNVRERDHVRVWKSKLPSPDSRPVWVGAATRDIKVALSPRTHLPNHLIEPEVDKERDFLTEDLSATGWVVAEQWTPGTGKLEHKRGGDGYDYITDGRVVMLTLADVPVLPFAQQVRGKRSARLIQRVVAPLLRRRLPKLGRERAREVQATRDARQIAASVTAASQARPDEG
jgi:LssY C-terminus